MNDIWMIFASQEATGSAINLVILLLFAIGVIDVLIGWQRLDADRRIVSRARAAIAGADLATKTPEAILRALGVPAASLLGRRIDRILQLRRAGLGNRDVLQQLTLERVGNYGSHARFIATILTMLGLVGTVIGMSMAMLKISGAFTTATSVQALNELTRALGGTLEGMKTAFACTLAGLSGAVILSTLNHVLRLRQSAVVRELEEFVTCELIPALERVDPDADGAAKAFATVLHDATETMSTLGGVVAAAAAQFTTTGGQMERTVGALSAAIEQLVKHTATLAGQQQEMDRRIAAAQTSLNDSRALQDAIVAHNAQLNGFIDQSTKHLQTALKEMLVDVNQHYRDGVRGHVEESQKQLTAVIKDNTARFSDLLGQHSTKLQSFSDMLLDLYVNGSSARAKGGTA